MADIESLKKKRTADLTAEELLAIARHDNPAVRYTRNKQGTAIAGWKDGTWQTVAMRAFQEPRGPWVSVGDLFIDGIPVNKPEDWIPDA